MTFEIIALICAIGVEPQACQPEAGARVVEKIGEGQSEIECLRQGLLSSGGAVTKPRDGEFEKIMCLRKNRT